MNPGRRLRVKLIHCGNVNIAVPQDNSQKNIFYMPMGLFPMADVLKKHGFNIEIIHLDLESESPIEEILDLEAVDAVGFDCHWVNQSLVVMSTVKLLKERNPRIFTFLGGFSASLFAEEIVAGYPEVNAVIKGDGETPILELCRSLQAQLTGTGASENLPDTLSFEDVPNLVWRKPGNKVTANAQTYVATAEDMEKLDFAAVELLRNWKNYRDLSKFWSRFTSVADLPKFLLSVGRGCVYNCSFCGGNSIAQHRMNNRKGQIVRSVDSVVETIKKAMSYGFSLFYTCYEFEGCDAWYRALFQRIKEEKLRISYCYGCYSLPSKELVDIMSDACEEVMIELSPETSSLELRKKNKDARIYYDNRQLEESLEYMGAKPNVKVQVFFAYFLPFETEETLFSTMRYISGLFSRFFHFTELIYGNLSTDPGSLLFFDPEAYDVEIKVRCFRDYLEQLNDNYVLRKGKDAPDMTIFKPTAITDRQFIQWSGKIRLFGYLFSLFSQSLRVLFDQVGDTGVVADFIQEMEIASVTDEDLTVDKMKELFIEICEEHIMLDPEILQAIQEDYRLAPAIDIRLKANI